MSRIHWRQALPTGFADALIWVWFLQTAYLSRFTGQVSLIGDLSHAMPYLSVGVCVALSILLMALRWDAVPPTYRVACSVTSCLSTVGLLTLASCRIESTAASIAVYCLFVLSYYGSQILRIETLAKCPDTRTLLMALIVSLLTYYALSALLLVVPSTAYNTLIVIAPLSLLYRALRPLSPWKTTGDGKRTSTKIGSFVNIPTALLILFGISGGLISAHGGSNPAITLTALFRMPDPAHLIMVLANMALGILATRKLRAPRGMYFAFMSIVWMGGALVGAFLVTHLPPLSNAVFMVAAGAIGIAIVASFVMDGGLWTSNDNTDSPAYPAESSQRIGSEEKLNAAATEQPEEPAFDEETVAEQDPLGTLASDHGLTPREEDVLRLLAEGRSVPVICNRLVISEGTARTHVKHIYQKLGIHNRQELFDFVRR